MLQISTRPYHLLGLNGLLLLGLSFFFRKQSLGIHLPGISFVFTSGIIFIVIGLFLLVFWIFYRLANKHLISSFLSWVHIVFTLMVVLVVVTIPFWGNASYKPILVVDWSSFEQFRKVSRIAAIGLLIFIWGQVSFILNFIGGFFLLTPKGNVV